MYVIGALERAAVLLSEGTIPPEEAAYLDDVTIAENLTHWGIAKLALDINAMMVAYLFGDLERARAMEAKSVASIGATFGHIGGEPELRFYQALLFAALFPSAPNTEKEAHRKTIDSAVEQMSVWAEFCPEELRGRSISSPKRSSPGSKAGTTRRATSTIARSTRRSSTRSFTCKGSPASSRGGFTSKRGDGGWRRRMYATLAMPSPAGGPTRRSPRSTAAMPSSFRMAWRAKARGRPAAPSSI